MILFFYLQLGYYTLCNNPNCLNRFLSFPLLNDLLHSFVLSLLISTNTISDVIVFCTFCAYIIIHCYDTHFNQ